MASMRLGGDVAGLEPEAQTSLSERTHNPRHQKPARNRMVCHRILLDTLARDLSTFSWCKVLLSCVADAVEGAQQAYTAGILHRDISAGNITIVKEWRGVRGVLIDWDMSHMTLLPQKHEGEVRIGRIGTWAFTSAKILSTPGRVAHTLWDDMESAFWVLVYHALRYLKHDYEPHPLSLLLQQLFTTRVVKQNGSVIGGRFKKTVMGFCTLERMDEQLPHFGVNGLDEALQQLGAIFDARYAPQRPEQKDIKEISGLLRHMARTMAPLSMTPTALVSPTTDSDEPPADPKARQPVRVDTVEQDLDPMPWSGIAHQ